MIQVELYETQVTFLEQLTRDGRRGATREDALRTILLEHVNDRLQGAAAYIGGTVRDDVLRLDVPAYGARRFQRTLEPIMGKAMPVRRGEVLRIEQLVGGQCVDLNAYNLHDYKEALDCGFTRSFQSFAPRRGDFIWTNAPRGRPMFAIIEMADTCEVDLVGHRCNRVFMELGWNSPEHANCQDTLAEAIREYGLTPDDVHDSFNLWMSTTVDENGRRQYRWNPARKGDRVDLLALFDTLAVVCICGNGDLLGLNNYTFAPVSLEIYEPSAGTSTLADTVEARWGSLASQVRTQDLEERPVLATRQLTRDDTYKARFRPPPAKVLLELELGPDDERLAAGLQATGVYGTTTAEVIRAAFMRWCNRHHTPTRRARLDFASNS
jgi:uncharacterized protein YcgI (DUF1989 family)